MTSEYSHVMHTPIRLLTLDRYFNFNWVIVYQ